MFEITGTHNTAKVFAKDLEEFGKNQVLTLCEQSFCEGSQIRLMPDAHGGRGCVIGTTMTITDKIVPNLVGVDISCGVEGVNIGPDSIDFARLDQVIRERVPSGFSIRAHAHDLSSEIDLMELSCAPGFKEGILSGKAAKSIGTLGGGNHFIEIDKDEKTGDHWLFIHSGSRNPGLQVANHHQKVAQSLHPDAPKDLAWLSGSHFDDYVHDMKLMQKFADLNRRVISMVIMDAMGWSEKDRFTTVHNYLDTDTMILRKGAVSARKGERLAIPINMRDGTLICEGLGNHDWNCSAPHGAGRLMSRADAKKNLSMDEFTASMEGIFTTSVSENTLDEAPGAYKPLRDILEAIGETATVLALVKPVYNFKANEKPIGRKKRL